MDYFRDKVAIVTGAGSGIGRALCREMGRGGAVVVATDLCGEAAEETARSIRSSGGRAGGVCLDVTRAGDIRKIIEDTVADC